MLMEFLTFLESLTSLEMLKFLASYHLYPIIRSGRPPSEDCLKAENMSPVDGVRRMLSNILPYCPADSGMVQK